jgi:hypothetical protein
MEELSVLHLHLQSKRDRSLEPTTTHKHQRSEQRPDYAPFPPHPASRVLLQRCNTRSERWAR